MNEKLTKPYNPRETEDRIYSLWQESGFFNPDICIEKGVTSANAETFSMVLPPPNVTGTLHIGHGSVVTIEDIIIRFERMRGKRTLWIPGTDHAAIATQSKVEAEMYKKEKKTRFDIGREEFLARVNEFAKQSHDTIVGQIKKLGASLDWSREAYTLDADRSLAVRTAFKKMYDDGLIYQGVRLVNWDPDLQTVVSDDEIEWVEEKTPLYKLKYGPFTIATTRPETKFGDKYVVMHPDDPRYAEYKHGDTLNVEWINGPITATVIKDPIIDMEFGTGVMTITPWHDSADFDLAERHKLPKEQVIDLGGKLLPIAGEFAGMHIKKARPKIIEKLQEKGLVEGIEENYVHNIATNSRGGGKIEPQIQKQWFIAVHKEFKMREPFLPGSKLTGVRAGDTVTLAGLMRRAVESGDIKIIPDRFEKIYFHWINNLRDWCISRQIWFGHQIPVWYRKSPSGETLETYVGVEAPTGASGAASGENTWEQDPDTLDTWFSSGLWTFSTLGWPRETADLKNYHPTAVLETAYDILFFWVARMILMSTYLMGDMPFKTVYLHGLVRDASGRKMSKSLGNIIDPLVMIDKYGADATRLSLIIGTGPGNDSKMSEDKIRGYKHFGNKLWNIARFVLSNTADVDFSASFPATAHTENNQKLLEELRALTADVTSDMEHFRFYLAGEKLYHYIWHRFADEIIEHNKSIVAPRNDSTNPPASAEEKLSTAHMLMEILETCLKTLHPFMPFVTEEIWSMMPRRTNLLIVEKWPK